MNIEINRTLSNGATIVAKVPNYKPTHIIAEFPNGGLIKLPVDEAILLLDKTKLEQEFEAVNVKLRAAKKLVEEANELVAIKGKDREKWGGYDGEGMFEWERLHDLLHESFFWNTSSGRCYPE